MNRSIAGRVALLSVVFAPLVLLALSRGSAIGTGAAAAAFGVVLWLSLRSPLRELRALTGPLKESVRATLLEYVAFFRALPPEEQRRFQARVQLLLATLEFETVADEEFTEELRVLAVAGAAVVAHGLPTYRFRTERTLLLYPDSFDGAYDVGEEHNIVGMVHYQGPIVFSRTALVHGWDKSTDANNVSIHEWAHVLDLDDRFADGIPGFVSDLDRWNEVLDDELDKAQRQSRTALRAYAGTNRAETFAVAAEVFFERPLELKRKNPLLFQLLADGLGHPTGPADQPVE